MCLWCLEGGGGELSEDSLAVSPWRVKDLPRIYRTTTSGDSYRADNLTGMKEKTLILSLFFHIPDTAEFRLVLIATNYITITI